MSQSNVELTGETSFFLRELSGFPEEKISEKYFLQKNQNIRSFSETEFCSVAQAGFELEILLP
jgi:hypothetical protein